MNTPPPGPTPSAPAPPATPARKPENIWLNLGCNIVLPAVILSNLSGEHRLGPLGALLVGLAFPLGYGIYDVIARKTWNLFSIVGVVSVSLTGGLGVAKVGGAWFAVKDAAMPAMFAIASLATLRTKRPLVRAMLFNETVVDVPRVEAALAEKGTRAQFDRLLVSSTWILAGGFVLSAVLNFVLARIILKSPGGTPEFTAELGRMHWVSFPVIVVPFMAIAMFLLWRLLGGVQRLTGLTTDDMLHADKKTKPAGNTAPDAKG